ncbi:AAA family ATPase [Mesorhizobium caraganae]|uniref:AAA family ATPase n=1 Tax=Mesorhizobium caraganae TaxID=483206 RepID=UPI003ED0B85F
MQYVDRDRVPSPSVFRASAARAERQAVLDFLKQSSERQAQSAPPTPQFEPDRDVLSALEKLFESKCAFCESRVPLNIHRFRPGEEATPLAQSQFAHLYYVWLRTDWNNHYPVCERCSRNAYRQFPVVDGRRGRVATEGEVQAFLEEDLGIWRFPHRDRPLIIDPCRVKDYTQHFSVDLTGRLDPRSKAGATTIATFDLDRDPLVAARRQAYDQYLSVLFSELDRRTTPSVLDFPRLEFGGTWYLLLRRLLDEASKPLGRTIVSTRPTMGKQFIDVWRTDIGRSALTEAVELIREPAKRKAIRARIAKRGADRLIDISLDCFKSLERMEVTVPEPIAENRQGGRPAEAAALLVLGENAAGKSSLLEAVALALCGEDVRDNLRKPAKDFLLDPTMMGAPNVPSPKQGLVRLRFSEGGELSLGIGQEFTEQNDQTKLPPVFAYGAFRHYGLSRKRTPRFGHVGTLFRSDVILPNPEAWLLGLNDVRFAMVVRAIREIFSIEGEFEILERDTRNDRCLLVTHVGDDAASEPIRTPLGVASSGYRSVLAMVCDILEGSMGRSDRNLQPLDEVRAVILIDEIEAHLHPRWKMQIMASLRRVLPRSVIIATSHDPLCLRGMHSGEVIVFHRTLNDGDELRMPMVTEAWSDLPDVENLTVEQLLTSDLFAMFSTDSPATERRFAELAALLSRQTTREQMSVDELLALDALEAEVADALPLGTSQAQRLVLTAVAEFLSERRTATEAQLRELEADARRRIVAALEAF